MTPAVIKPTVTMSDLEKLDIRVGTIRAVDAIANSRKLMALSVDFGDHSRTIVAGIKTEREDPTSLTGQQALFVVNLEPQTLAGVLSEGMLFDIGYADGITPVLAKPEITVPEGCRAG